MAITTTTISRAAGWARTDAIGQMGEALSYLEWHGGAISGLVTFATYSGGGTVGSSSSDYYCVNQTSTDGSGTGAQFQVDRNSGTIYRIYVNDGGSGYAEGDQITLKADDIGGSANGASDLVLTVKVDGAGSPVSYGSTTDFFSKTVGVGSDYPYGIQKHVIGAGKTYGTTYRGYQMYDDTQMYFHTGSGFMPYSSPSPYDGNSGRSPRYSGFIGLDVTGGQDATSSSGIFNGTNNVGGTFRQVYRKEIAEDNNYQLDLNIFRSALDPKFAVFSYRQPTLSSTTLDNNTFLTFFLHNFTTDIWDLDYLFLGGLTTIEPFNTLPDTTPQLKFTSYIAGETNTADANPSIRCAEWGYSSWDGNYSTVAYKETIYSSTSSLTHDSSSYRYANIYNRNNIGGNGTTLTTNGSRGRGGYHMDIKIPSAANYNAVIKGIPLSTGMVPCPYYIPDDFVLIDFSYDYPGANIQQWDTVTVSGSEIYTVITGSYSNATKTQGILFCARTT